VRFIQGINSSTKRTINREQLLKEWLHPSDCSSRGRLLESAKFADLRRCRQGMPAHARPHSCHFTMAIETG
jgi:hypothetical protein